MDKIILGVIFFISIFARILLPHNPFTVNLEEKLLSPSLTYFFGTDYLGRDIFSRVILGTQITFLTSLIVALLSTWFGMILGIFSSVYSGCLEKVVIRVIDLLDSFPSIIIVLMVTSFWGSNIISLGFALFLVGWTSYARVARTLTRECTTKEFVLYSKVLGKSNIEIIFRDIIPNIFSNILIISMNNFAGVILSLAGYSFLGFGMKPPGAELGMMINEGREYMNSRPEMMIVPGVMIFIMVIAINALGGKIKERYEQIRR